MAIPAAVPPLRNFARSQLAWRCRRGMKELDLLLLGWLEADFAATSAEQRRLFSVLLELPDPQLARYLIGGERPEDAALAALVASIAGNSLAAVMSSGHRP